MPPHFHPPRPSTPQLVGALAFAILLMTPVASQPVGQSSDPWAPRGSPGLYLHVPEVDAPFPIDFAEVEALRVALYVGDPSIVAASLRQTELTEIEVAPDHVLVSVGTTATFVEPPRPYQSRASFVVDFEEPVFASLLQELSGERPSVDELIALADRVLSEKSSARGFSPASAVVRSHAGGCTEHAVVLTALARAAGSPARLVIGTLLAETEGRVTAYGHAWSEIWDGERWRTADAALHGAVESGLGLRYLPAAFLTNEGPDYGEQVLFWIRQQPSRIALVADN